ncbi:hypothetical protein DOTSEDRAFT_35317 [Dothistroma septosporum NZE10]|uniref:Uncharacterized protein n=1 Tax=Dothistroma septosporum (strain NZE10 / CBS 128990) TaxID=675120 RepID=M2WLP7_DOTSN|nr:hypothetical protein DOTSEDRAFT_35317 [Dothistroma septosporum NZE10]
MTRAGDVSTHCGISTCLRRRQQITANLAKEHGAGSTAAAIAEWNAQRAKKGQDQIALLRVQAVAGPITAASPMTGQKRPRKPTAEMADELQMNTDVEKPPKTSCARTSPGALPISQKQSSNAFKRTPEARRKISNFEGPPSNQLTAPFHPATARLRSTLPLSKARSTYDTPSDLEEMQKPLLFFDELPGMCGECQSPSTSHSFWCSLHPINQGE